MKFLHELVLVALLGATLAATVYGLQHERPCDDCIETLRAD